MLIALFRLYRHDVRRGGGRILLLERRSHLSDVGSARQIDLVHGVRATYADPSRVAVESQAAAQGLSGSRMQGDRRWPGARDRGQQFVDPSRKYHDVRAVVGIAVVTDATTRYQKLPGRERANAKINELRTAISNVRGAVGGGNY